MSRKVVRKPTPGTVTPTQFRLAPEVLADLDLVVQDSGLTTRTEAVRMLIKREADRVRRKEKGQ